MAEDLTAEADSGGHTDNRPAISLLPIMIVLRDELAQKHTYINALRRTRRRHLHPLFSRSGICHGRSLHSHGIRQSVLCGSRDVRIRPSKMLADARQADVTMAPAADMFEIGAKVQVLKRGTMFPLRAAKLHDLYPPMTVMRAFPKNTAKMLERDFFQCSFQAEWEQTKAYFTPHDPKQIERAEKDPKHKMAGDFDPTSVNPPCGLNRATRRQIDYQIWCGPAMGAFNQWVKGTFLTIMKTVKPNRCHEPSLWSCCSDPGQLVEASRGCITCRHGQFFPMPIEKIQELLRTLTSGCAAVFTTAQKTVHRLPCFLCIEDFAPCPSSAANPLETRRFLNICISLPVDIILIFYCRFPMAAFLSNNNAIFMK